MNQRYKGQRLTLQDRHAAQRYIQTQDPIHPQIDERATNAHLYTISQRAQPERISRKRKSRPVGVMVFVFSFATIIMLAGYYILTSGNLLVTMQSQKMGSSDLAMLKDIAQTRINQYSTDVEKIKQAGGAVASEQQKLEVDRAKLSAITSANDVIALLIQIGSDLTALQGDLADKNASTLLRNFQQEAQHWGKAHEYHDPYDKQNYFLNSSYLNVDGHNGIQYGEGTYMNDEINAGNPQASQDIKDDYFLLSMMEANYEDAAPYNQPHQVDQALLNYFGYQHMHVLVVSLTEQALRIYKNGQLEQAFQITAGRVYRPTPVGHFQFTQHFYNYTLTSYDSPGSPDYYPPVVVQNAIQFFDNGYLIHSSSWRKDYGPFTQFPHQDSGKDPQASVGSHGCINVSPAILSNLDQTITYGTPLIIF